MFAQLLEFITSRDILDPLQSGFRKLHSTSTALLKIIEDIKIAKSEGCVTILVLLDYSKAFDCVLQHFPNEMLINGTSYNENRQLTDESFRTNF